MIRFLSIVQNKDRSWTFNWTPTGATTYRVVLNGSVLAEQSGPPYDFKKSGYPDEPPPVEVAEDDELAPSEENEPFLTIQWWPNRDATHYHVEQWDGSAWHQVGSSFSERPHYAVYTYHTKLLADETQHQFRVRAFDALGQASAGVVYAAYMVRPPVLYEVDTVLSYDAGTTTITVSAAP